MEFTYGTTPVNEARVTLEDAFKVYLQAARNLRSACESVSGDIDDLLRDMRGLKAAPDLVLEAEEMVMGVVSEMEDAVADAERSTDKVWGKWK